MIGPPHYFPFFIHSSNNGSPRVTARLPQRTITRRQAGTKLELDRPLRLSVHTKRSGIIREVTVPRRRVLQATGIPIIGAHYSLVLDATVW